MYSFLSDITSGYKVGEDVSVDPDYYDLCGFTGEELREALQGVVRVDH